VEADLGAQRTRKRAQRNQPGDADACQCPCGDPRPVHRLLSIIVPCTCPVPTLISVCCRLSACEPRTLRVGVPCEWESCMAFKLRLQIFFLILTVVPLLVGGWMIQRTVIDSKRSAVDQRLATGVGTLGTQYAGVLAAGRRALATVPQERPLQRAIVDQDNKTIASIARQES